MRKDKFIWILLLLCSFQIGKAQHNYVFPYDRAIKIGDEPAWADKLLNTDGWERGGNILHKGNFWVRFKIQGDSILERFDNPGLEVISIGSYEAYWDGVLIAKSGKVGRNKEEETPGKFNTQILIPDSLLTSDEHNIAFRVSNYHLLPIFLESWNLIYLEEYGLTLRKNLKLTARMFVLAGIYLMAGLYYLFLFVWRKREKEGLIFSIMCFLFFGLILLEYLKFLYAYPYYFHYVRLLFIYILTLSIAFFTPLFFILYFKFPWRKLAIGSVIIALAIISFINSPGSDNTNLVLSMSNWYSSFGIVLFAVYKKEKEAWPVLLALIFSGTMIWFYEVGFRALVHSYDITLFISLSLIVLSMMYLLARRTREQRIAYEASLTLSSRLQSELLKKNIQPHFIMNTLTSLMEWVEESPKESVHFIEALAKEFEIMSEIAEKKLIPIEQEIALCQYHIEIMKYRKEIDYIFETGSFPENEMIPPAIFHTIIEDGISHSLPNEQNQIRIHLTFTENAKNKSYELITYAKSRKTDKNVEGTGLKYVKSRLKENYGDAWYLDSSPIEKGWKTKIVLLKN